MAAPKLTLDTNCLINYFDSESRTATSREEIAELIRYATSGRADIAITTRAEADLNQDRDNARRRMLKSKLEMFVVIPSGLRFDESTWGGGDVWTSNSDRVIAEEIQKILFPGLEVGSSTYGNKIRDVDHIVAHIMSKRDIFVTDDKHLTRRAKELEFFGAIIMTPKKCVEFIERFENPEKPKSLTTSFDAKFHSVGRLGKVTFDYSDNDGCYAIGQGHFLFETKWSKASNVEIYAYKEMSSVAGVALVKGMSRIDDITNASIYNYSSRVRSARVGDIVIWQNVNGLYAATKILKIEDNGRGAKHDELSFEFQILTEGISFS